MWIWLDFYFVEVDRAKLCAATAGPRGNLDWSRLGSFSPEIFCAATLLKRKSHNLTLLTKRKQHKTNTLHTPKNVTYKKRTVWKQEAGSFTRFFPAYGFGNPQTYKIKNTRNGKTLGLWMSFGYLLDFSTVTISIKNLVFQLWRNSGEISFCEKKMHHPTMAQLRFLFCRGWKLSSRPMNSTKTYQKNLWSH